MILQASHLKKSFLGETVIQDATFALEETEKAAIVGNNGAGKTTLFRLITSDLLPDEGTVFLKKDVTVGYLKQESDLTSDRTVFEEALSVREDVLKIGAELRKIEASLSDPQGYEERLKRYSALTEAFEKQNGYAVTSNTTGVLKGLGFSEDSFSKPVSVLSGGEKTRVALAKLLLEAPDLLLLDEPTNHLDIQAVVWLENYLKNYKKAVLLVSHDRYFLDRTVDQIIDLSNGRTRTYEGNYTVFQEKKKAVLSAEQKAYEKQQDRIRHEEAVIETLKSFNREKSIRRAESREKMLSKIERIEKPFEERNDIRLSFDAGSLSGKDVLTARNLSKRFGNATLFEGVSLEIRRGEKVAVIGPNGAGKTTFLKLLTGDLLPDEGSVTPGANVSFGYYDQTHDSLPHDKTVFEAYHDLYPRLTETEVRNDLAGFLFTGDDVFKPVEKLSGGEKSRLKLAELMHSSSNFLVLDEPTNHLDMAGKEALEQALKSYEGTLLTVSHDRYFINTVSTRIIELYRNTFINYEGNYDYYLEKRDDFHRLYDEAHPHFSAEKDVSEAKELRRIRKEAESRNRKKETRIRTLEEAMHRLEEEIASLEASLSDPAYASDAEMLIRLTEEKAKKEEALNKTFAEWESEIDA